MCLYEFRQSERFNYRRFLNYFSDNVNSEDIDDDKRYFYKLLINTQNGKSLFNKTKEDLIYFAKDFQKSIEKSPRLHNLQKPETYEQFWQDYAQHDFCYMLKLFLNVGADIK